MNKIFIFIALCVIAFIASIMLFGFGNKKIEKTPIRIATNPWSKGKLVQKSIQVDSYISHAEDEQE